jgi:hypothetical protein
LDLTFWSVDRHRIIVIEHGHQQHLQLVLSQLSFAGLFLHLIALICLREAAHKEEHPMIGMQSRT